MSDVGRTSNTSNKYNVVFTDKKDNATMGHMDFLNLMVKQMQNQDFTSPMDNTQMMTQMVQFSNLQMMQEMATYSKTNYAMSLVGKNVTASRFTVSGELDTTTGMVEKVSLVDNEYVIYVAGKKYGLDQIMSIESGTISSDTVPEKYKLYVDNLGENSATLTWPVPTEDETEASELKYSVYYSTDSAFNTLENVEKGTLVGDKNQKGITEMEITDLIPGTEYYVNVVVTDKNGNKRIFSAAEFKTLGIAPEIPEIPEVPNTPETPETPEGETGGENSGNTGNEQETLDHQETPTSGQNN